MPPGGVVEAFDVVEDIGACGLPRGVVFPVAPLGLHRREETLHHRVFQLATQRAIEPPVEGRLTRFLLKIPNGQTSAYAIRGTWVLPALTVRLVGAPGDTDADSVWFAGTADLGDYVGTLIHGDLNGRLELRARAMP
jgi:hypothetical protein